MYLSDYLERKQTAESVSEPRYIEKQLTLDGAIDFLKEYKGLPYPQSWFLSKPERTISMYKQQYVLYWKQFLVEFREYDRARNELKTLEYARQQGFIIDDREWLTQSVQSSYQQI